MTSEVKVTEGNLNSDNLGGSDVSVKITGGGKGALANIVAQPGVLMDQKTNSGVLANMERLAAEINNPYRKMQEGLKDMTAWTAYNKAPAFALREEAANTDRANLYNIRQQQAAIEAAQLQAQAEAENIARFKQKISGGAGAGAGAGGAGAPNAAQQQLLAALETVRPNDVGAQRALINKFNEAQISGSSKAQYDAAANSPVTYMVPGKGPVSITPNMWNNMPAETKRNIEIATFKELGYIPPPPGSSANAPQTTVPTTSVQGGPSAAAPSGEKGNAVQIASSLNIPIISGDRDWDKQYNLYLNSKKPGYSGPPVAFPGTSKHQTGYAIDAGPITADQRQQLIDAGFKQTVRNDPNHWELVGKPAETAVVSGGAAPTAPIVSGGPSPMRPIPVEKTLTPGESVVPTPVAAAKPVVTPATTQTAPTAPTAPAAAPVQGPSAVQTATAQDPMPQAKDFGLNKDAYLAAMDAWKTRQSQKAQGLGAASTDIAKVDADKKNEYLSSIGTTSKTYDEYKRLLESSKDKKGVFNLAGQSWYGPVAAKITPKMETDPTEHHAIARTWLPEKYQTDFKNIEQGASVAQAAWAKNLVQGAGGRLTNADLALGKPAKGVGIETTYESHMENLAKNMQDIRTAYYRGLAFDKWSRQNPNGSAAEFEQTPYYEFGSKVDAAKDVGKEFKGVPEANFVKKDANGKPYVVVNGKGIYL